MAGRPGERGSTPVSATAGFVAFVAFLLLAVQVLVDLHATSVLTAAAYDAARQVAGSAGGPDAVTRAESEARRLLGGYGRAARFDWAAGGDEVVLRITADSPALLLPVPGGSGDRRIERTVRVRTERFR